MYHKLCGTYISDKAIHLMVLDGNMGLVVEEGMKKAQNELNMRRINICLGPKDKLSETL